MKKKNLLDSTCGHSDKKVTQIFKKAVKEDVKARSKKGLPQAKYDAETKKAYLEYPGGRKVYV